jgi:hypothetical protein
MRNPIIGILLVLGSCGFLAAGEGSPYEKALQQVLDSFNKIGDSLKTIVDEDSANTAKPDLRKAAAGFLDARTKAEKMQPPDKAEKVRLEKAYKEKLEGAMKKMFTEVRRVELVPGGRDALKEISSILKKDSK